MVYETKKYVKFLMDSAENLTKQIKKIIPENYEELEMIYFISFVMCDLLQVIDLPDEQHWKIVNEFLKKHLIIETINIIPKNFNERISYLNEKNIVRTDRLNEFKNHFSLIEGIAKNDDKKVQNLANRASAYICLNKSEVHSFSEELVPILKEYSLQNIDELLKLSGYEMITGIVDVMISQEKNIKLKIRNHIAEIPNELELYYYVFYLIYSYYKKVDEINQSILNEYSSKSLDNLITSIKSNISRGKILRDREEKFEYYDIMWNQIDDDYESTNNMAMFFGFASKYIYEKKTHSMTLTLLHTELLGIIYTGIESYLKVAIDSFKTSHSFLDKVRSFFK